MLSNHSIEINPLVLEVHGTEELVGVIKHELCHYHLHIEGRGYRHRDADFRKFAKAHIFPEVLQAPFERKQKLDSMCVYECLSCKLLYNRRRRMDVTEI